MKRLLFSVLAGALFLAGCADQTGADKAGDSEAAITVRSTYPTVAEYTKYLAPSEGSEDDLEYSYEQDTANAGTIYLYLDNHSDTNYVMADVAVYPSADSTDALTTQQYPLVRPGSYSYGSFESETTDLFYHLTSAQYYILDYDSVPYRYIEDNEADGSDFYIDILADAPISADDLVTLAKKEYAIAVLTNYMESDYYFYDANVTYLADYPDYPDKASAAYNAKFDYDAKTIRIYQGSAQDEQVGSDIVMD